MSMGVGSARRRYTGARLGTRVRPAVGPVACVGIGSDRRRGHRVCSRGLL